MPSKSAVSVYVRCRPMTQFELVDDDTRVQWMPVDGDDVEIIHAPNSDYTANKFFLEKHKNIDIFRTALSPCLHSVLTGGTVAAFAYGHSGAGKSHTIMGYYPEDGLLALTAKELLNNLQPPLLLHVRFAEMYNGKFYDLLNDGSECYVREDANGDIQIRGTTIKSADGAVVTMPLRGACCRTFAEFEMLTNKAISQRTVGSSNVHDQSSRSHALVEMEIVSEELMAAREAIMRAEGAVVPVGKLKTTINIRIQMSCYRKTADNTYEHVREPTPAENKEIAEIEAKFQALESKVSDAVAVERQILSLNPSLGGTVILVDLAGADYESAMLSRMDAKQKREFSEINRSLLALKECMRAMKQCRPHVPFRDSPLTKVLKKFLLGKNVQSVMIANVSPSSKNLNATINTLRYAQMIVDIGSK